MVRALLARWRLTRRAALGCLGIVATSLATTTAMNATADQHEHATALLFTAVPAPRAEAFHALFAAVFAGGAAQQLRVDSHGQLLPVVELLFPHAALTGALRVGDLSNMAYLASADPSGRSTSMAAALTALRDAGRLLA